MTLSDDPARVLVVDDDRLEQRLLEVMLTPEGVVVVPVGSGEEALELIALAPPDLILLDVLLPGMDGFEVVTRLKRDPQTMNIPVILVTALTDREARMRGLNAGAEDFLTKPIDRAELCARVRNLLRLKAYGDFHDRYGPLLDGITSTSVADVIASEGLLRSAFDAAPVALAIVDATGRWVHVNQRLLATTGTGPRRTPVMRSPLPSGCELWVFDVG
jgi:DNA-binding response OmpR family regulator